MILAVGIIIFVLGCCLSSFEDSSYNTQQRQEQRYNEIIQALSETKRTNEVPVRRKQTRRRFAMDKAGNLLGEEITEEELED